MASNTTVIEIVTTVEDKTKTGAASATSTVSKLEKAMRKAQTEIEKMRKMSKIELTMYAVDKASKVLNGVWNTGKKLTGKVWKVTLKAVDLVTAPFRGIMKTLTNPVVAIAGIAGVSLGISDLIGTYKDFEQGMANVKAITRGTDENMAKLTQTAKKLGEETMFSAKQVSGAMEFLAMAGWKTEDIISGMPGLLNLAAAGGVEVATAADVVSSALAQFNMKAKEADRVADVLAATATNSKTDITGLGESLKYAGSMAGALKYSIEDTALALGLMGDRGIDSSMAGTGLRSLITRMSKQGELTGDEKEAVAVAMKKVRSIAFDKKTGEAKSLMDIMRQLRAGYKKLKTTEKGKVASDLAGTYGQAGLLAIVEASEDKFNSLAKAIENSKGAAEAMAKIRMESLEGSMLYLQSAADGVKLAFMEKLAPYLKEFIDWLTSKMPDLKNTAVDFADSIAKKIESVTKSVEDMVNSPEWKNVETFWDKVKVAWNKLIAEPFDEWWSGTGKAWLADKAKSIGEGLGKAVTFGFTALFGGDTDGIVQDGVSIGASFGVGFSKGFDGAKVAEAIKNAVSSALKLVFSNPVTGGLASAWIGGKVLGGISGAYNMFKVTKPLLFGGGTAAGMAANTTSSVAEMGIISFVGKKALETISNVGKKVIGKFAAVGTKLGSGAASAGGLAFAGAASVTGGITTAATLISAASDFYKAAHSKDEEEADVYTRTAGLKAGGAAVGAALGTLFGGPGIGTMIGAGIGSGIGNLIGGSVESRYEETLQKREEEKAKALLAKKKAKYESHDLKKALENKDISDEELKQMVHNKGLEKLKKAFGNINLTLAEIKNTAEKLIFGNAAESLNTFSAAEEADNDLRNFQNTALSLKKINWKASLGVKWTEDDNSDFASTARSMTEQAKKLLIDKHYEADMAINLLYGKDSETGKNRTIDVDNIYKSLQKQVDGYSSKIEVILNKDGILTLSEQKEINNLLNQITEITDKVSKAEAEAGLDTDLYFLGEKFGGGDLDIDSFLGLQQEIPNIKEKALENWKKAYEKEVHEIKLQAKLDPEFSDEEAKEAIEAAKKQYEEALSSIDEKIFNFNLDSMAKVFDNMGIAEKLLPEGFAGTAEERLNKVKEVLSTKIKEALTLADGDANRIDADTWVKIFGLNDLNEFAEKSDAFASLLKPVAGNLSEGFIKSFEPESKSLADTAHRIVAADLEEQFKEKIPVNMTVALTPKFEIQAAHDKLSGENINYGPEIKKFNFNLSGPGIDKEGHYFEAKDNKNAKFIPAKAEGDILTKPQLALVAEDGAEAIIPLSGKRRNRGISLWEKAGKLLGIKPYKNKGIEESVPAHAEGGIFGYVSDSETKENVFDRAVDNSGENRVASEPVTVNLGGINITINASEAEGSNDIMEIIRRNMPEISNEVAGTIAKALMNLFANMKAGVI